MAQKVFLPTVKKGERKKRDAEGLLGVDADTTEQVNDGKFDKVCGPPRFCFPSQEGVLGIVNMELGSSRRWW